MATRTIDYLFPRAKSVSTGPTVDPVAGEPRPLVRHLRKTFRWMGRAFLFALIASLFLVVIDGFVPVFMTPLMFVRAFEAVTEGHLPHVEKTWVSLDQISPRLQHAVIAAEDMKFYEHKGFDWEAIEKAYRANSRKKPNATSAASAPSRNATMRGASTISQQTAKNVFLWPSRNWLRKGLETGFTALIELVWTKKRILEVYLNVVELGDGVYGAEAAAQKYFKKPASALTASEAALMAAVLPNPRRFSIAKPSAYIRIRQTMIQRRMWAAAESVPSRTLVPLAQPASK